MVNRQTSARIPPAGRSQFYVSTWEKLGYSVHFNTELTEGFNSTEQLAGEDGPPESAHAGSLGPVATSPLTRRSGPPFDSTRGAVLPARALTCACIFLF